MISNFPLATNPDKLSEYIKFIEEYPLIEKISKTDEDSTETHHIIPRCLGGTDDEDNLIELRLKDHAIAHLLLSESYPENLSLSHAAWLMNSNYLESPRYEDLRKIHTENLRVATIKRNKEYFFMHRGDEEIYVKREDRLVYEEIGYVEGMSFLHKKKLGDSHRGKKKTEEVIKKISESNKSTHLGDIWVNNGIKELTIPERELHDYESLGYTRGRKPFSSSHRANLSREFSIDHRKNLSISAKKRVYNLKCQNCGEEFSGKAWNKKYCPKCEVIK